MELSAAFRMLWRRRRLVALGAIVAIALAIKAGPSPTPASGLAKTRVVLDTNQSQLITQDPSGSGSLPWRATIAAMQLSDNGPRGRIAAGAGIRVDRLTVVDPELGAPLAPASLPQAGAKAANLVTTDYLLNVYTDDVLPVITIEASGPDRAGAARLAQAAVDVLKTTATPYTTQLVQGVSISQVGPVDSRELSGSRGRMRMILVCFVVFCMWCGALLVRPALRGVAQALAESRRGGLQDPGAAVR